MAMKSEIVCELKKLYPGLGEGEDGIDDANYVLDLSISEKRFVKDGKILVILHPQDKPGFLRGTLNAIDYRYRTGDFEVEKASVHGFYPAANGSSLPGRLGKGFELFHYMPFKSDADVIDIERHFSRGDASPANLASAVAYLDNAFLSDVK
jgi:hypothetical protein